MSEETIVGKHIKCFLRNGMVLEGIPEEWSDSRVVLKALDGQSLMIVHSPTEDILLTKVMLVEVPEIPEETKVVEETDAKEQVREKLHEVLESGDDPKLQQMNLKQLRALVVQQEKQMIAQKRKEHFPSGSTGMAKYSHPYMPRPHPRSNQTRSAYQPGTLPSWVYGRPPKGR